MSTVSISGMATVRNPSAKYEPADECSQFFDDSSLDLLMRYDTGGFGTVDLRSATLMAYVNADPLAESEILNTSLDRNSVAATQWRISINKQDPGNELLDWENLDDIVLEIVWSFGMPPDYDDNDGNCDVPVAMCSPVTE